MGESLSPCTDLCSSRHREIQHICDPEGAECQEHDHCRTGQPAQLGAGFHVVSLQRLDLNGHTPWHSRALCWSCRAQPDTRVSSGTPFALPSALCPAIRFASKALPESNRSPLSPRPPAKSPLPASLHPGLLLPSTSYNLFSSRQQGGYF